MRLFILLCFLSPLFVYAEPYKYTVQRQGNHVIHIVEMDPKAYNLQIIKAHEQVFGRETLDMIARRTQADIAINGGFFEIGGTKDGMPSGTLVSNGRIFGLRLIQAL